MSTVTLMISIVINDQLIIFKIFDILCLPLLPYMMAAKKVDQMGDTFEKVKNKYCFRARGTHLDVTTLQQNNIFFSKMLDV